MVTTIPILILAILTILCLALVIRWILGDRRSSETRLTTTTEAITKSVIDFQASQTSQISALLERHSSDLSRVLSAQSGYISQFLNGPVQQAPDSQQQPLQPGSDQYEMADPANWSEADQLSGLPKQIQDEIFREQAEMSELDRLNQRSHNIHTDPRIPSIVPGLLLEEQQMPSENGSWTMSDDLEG